MKVLALLCLFWIQVNSFLLSPRPGSSFHLRTLNNEEKTHSIRSHVDLRPVSWLSASELKSELRSSIPQNSSLVFVPSEERQNLDETSKKGNADMLLVYTCKRCNGRNAKMIHKCAYENGVVIVQCKKCEVWHLIADNLGYFNRPNFGSNIEEYMERVGDKNIQRGSINPIKAKGVVDFYEEKYVGQEGEVEVESDGYIDFMAEDEVDGAEANRKEGPDGNDPIEFYGEFQ